MNKKSKKLVRINIHYKKKKEKKSLLKNYIILKHISS